MSLDNYFRLLRSNQHKRLINPVKRVDKFSSDSEGDTSDQPKQSFSDMMNEYLDEEFDAEDI